MKSKKELRKEILTLRAELTEKERREKSHQIAERVVSQKEFIEADKILLFASYNNEVETFEIFQAARDSSKDVYYPKVIEKEMEFYLVEKEADLVRGYRGIGEPEVSLEKQFRPEQTDKICVIMPGAVFDVEGNRIGYGGGYYDKYLQRLESSFTDEYIKIDKHIYKLAVAFECQLVEVGQIISDQHDIKPNGIVTENRVIDVRKTN